MPYLIETTIPPENLSLRDNTRQAHLDYLEATATSLLAAGAKLSDDGVANSGSVYLVDVEDRSEAERFLSADPYMSSGLITSASFTRVRKGFFNYRRVTPSDSK